jgi:hypothetical protein
MPSLEPPIGILDNNDSHCSAYILITHAPRHIHPGIIALTFAAKLALHAIAGISSAERHDQRRQIHQIRGAEMRSSCRHDDERIFRLDAGPARRQPQQVRVRVTIDNPVFTPSLYTIDEVDFPPKKRMEWMSDPDGAGHFYCTRCSSLAG